MELLDKQIKEVFIIWAQQPNVQGPEQLQALLGQLNLDELEQTFAETKLEKIIQEAKSSGKSDKWPDGHPAVPSIMVPEDMYLYLNITKQIFSSDLHKVKSLGGLTATEITTFGNQLKNAFSGLPKPLRDILLIPATMAATLSRMAQVRRLLNNFSGDSMLPPWSEDPRLWPNHDWSDYALACVNSQSGNNKGITTNSMNQEEKLNQLARAAVDSIENEKFVSANEIVAAVHRYFRGPGLSLVINFETEVHYQQTVAKEFLATLHQKITEAPDLYPRCHILYKLLKAALPLTSLDEIETIITKKICRNRRFTRQGRCLLQREGHHVE
jgi:hypothetical protein